MLKIFISYRREDSEHIAGRLYDRLEPHFGHDNLFMDIDTIPFGVDFREHLDQAVGKCDVLLAVIGEYWLEVCFKDGPRQGQRRLDDPTDFVRIELVSALDRGIPVIPVLVGKASMPSEADAQRDFVLGFIFLPFFFLLRASHQKCARWYPRKLHPKTVRDDLAWFSLWFRRMGLLPLFPHLLDDLLGSFLVNEELLEWIGGSFDTDGGNVRAIPGSFAARKT